MSEQPGRYQRSPSGLVGAMIVLLILIGAFVGLRACSGDNEATPVPTVDYATAMKQARNAGGLVAPAPDPLPRGWRATSVRYVSGEQPSWHLGMLTDKGSYVGIEEAQTPPSEMADTFVGAGASRGASTQIRGRTWQSWSDARGDHGITLRVGDRTVLVGGSAALSVIEDLTDQLSAPKLPS